MDGSGLFLRDKIMLLEKAVLNGTPEEVSALFRELDAAEFSARALGLACRFRGTDMAGALIDAGASFKRPDQRIFGGFMEVYTDAASRGRYTNQWNDYSLMILEPCRTVIVEGITPVGYDTDFGYINKAEDGGALPDAERLKLLELLCGERVGFDVNNVYFYAIMTGCDEFYEILRERGAALPENVRSCLINGNGRWQEFMALLYFAPREVFLKALERVVAELSPDDIIKRGGEFLEVHAKRLTDHKALAPVMERFDRSRMNQTKALKFLIDNDAADCLPVLEKAGWLRMARRRDELIKYASENGRTECVAWLLDFKNRTADLAAEREKEERKTRRELNAAPDSVTALRQIWSYTKQKDGTLRITNYKGGQTEVTVLEKIGSAKVGSIGGGAFSGARFDALRADPKQVEFRAGITKVTLPEGITVIGESAFSFTSLKRAELPQSVSEVGDSAFFGCEKLESITFTAREITLNSEALSGCDRLTEVIFAEGTERIRLGYDVFEGCEKLQRVVLPSTLRSVTLDVGEFFIPELCSDARVIVPRGSFAEDYCKKYKIEYQYLEE